MATAHDRAQQARGILIARARNYSIISYQELADVIGAGIPNGRPLANVLDLVARECEERREPDLAVLLACQDTGLPSQKWNVTAELIAKERVRCYDHWGFWTQRKQPQLQR